MSPSRVANVEGREGHNGRRLALDDCGNLLPVCGVEEKCLVEGYPLLGRVIPVDEHRVHCEHLPSDFQRSITRHPSPSASIQMNHSLRR